MSPAPRAALLLGPLVAGAVALAAADLSTRGFAEEEAQHPNAAPMQTGTHPLSSDAPAGAASRAAQVPQQWQDETPGRFDFYWTRGVYTGYGRGWGWGYGGGGGRSWATDFPKSDRQFVTVLQRLVRLNVSQWENPIPLDDPILRRFPVLYMVEVGQMNMTDEEVEGLRGYLDAGGFLIVDDFWGMREWQIFEENFRRVYPDKAIVDLPLEHPLFSAYYNITEVKQVPALGRGINGRPTAECRGCEAAVRGVFDDKGRLMVVINWNTDLGDAWEWAENPSYPLEYSTYAYEMGANMIVYAMSH